MYKKVTEHWSFVVLLVLDFLALLLHSEDEIIIGNTALCISHCTDLSKMQLIPWACVWYVMVNAKQGSKCLVSFYHSRNYSTNLKGILFLSFNSFSSFWFNTWKLKLKYIEFCFNFTSGLALPASIRGCEVWAGNQGARLTILTISFLIPWLLPPSSLSTRIMWTSSVIWITSQDHVLNFLVPGESYKWLGGVGPHHNNIEIFY